MKSKSIALIALSAALAAFGGTQTTKEYVDTQDAATLAAGKAYSDAKAVEVEGKMPSTNGFLTASWTNNTRVVIGNAASAAGENGVAIGKEAGANGGHSLALGEDSKALGVYSLSFGNGATANDDNDVAIGAGSVASNANAFAVGSNAKALGANSVAVGNNSTVRNGQSAAIGFGAETFGLSSSAFGVYAVANGLSSVAVGTNPKAYGLYSTAIGMQAIASNNYTVAIGNTAQALSSGAVAIGNSSKATNTYAIAIGHGSKAGENGLSFGYGAEAGQLSVAIGHESKARHTSSVAIGPMSETTADGTMRIKYSPSDIYLGFFTPKSLQAYFNELKPTIDWGIASNIVRNAEFLPSKYYYVYRGTTNMTAKWQWNALGYSGNYSTTISLLPANANSLVNMDIGDGAMISFRNGGRLNVLNGGEMWVPNPDAITFGSGQNQTNFNNYVKALARSAGGGGVSEARVGEIATNVVRAANGGLWDATLQVWWTPVMANGKLTYQATTNVNLQAGN